MKKIKCCGYRPNTLPPNFIVQLDFVLVAGSQYYKTFNFFNLLQLPITYSISTWQSHWP